VHAPVKEGYPLKSGYFAADGLCSVKTLAYRRTCDTPFNGVNVNDLE